MLNVEPVFESRYSVHFYWLFQNGGSLFNQLQLVLAVQTSAKTESLNSISTNVRIGFCVRICAHLSDTLYD